jgi:hypothetical protein
VGLPHKLHQWEQGGHEWYCVAYDHGPCSPLTSYGEDWSQEDVVEHERRVLVQNHPREFLKAALLEVDRLNTIVAEQKQEIARHHRDFERWEAMADRACARAIEAERKLIAIYEGESQ